MTLDLGAVRSIASIHAYNYNGQFLVGRGVSRLQVYLSDAPVPDGTAANLGHLVTANWTLRAVCSTTERMYRGVLTTWRYVGHGSRPRARSRRCAGGPTRDRRFGGGELCGVPCQHEHDYRSHAGH